MRNDWVAAANLVGRMLALLGALLVAIGGFKTAALYLQSHRGLETVATIDAAAGHQFGTGGWVDLSWRDDGGTMRQALGVQVTGRLARKLRLGSALARTHLRIRYRPDDIRSAILVIEDVHEQIKSAAALCIAGFLAISGGSGLILALMLSGLGTARTSSSPEFGAEREPRP